MGYWQQPCVFCRYPIKTIGLDRISSDVGYEIGNVQSACTYCNRAKSDLTQERFFDLCRQVVLTHGLLKQGQQVL